MTRLLVRSALVLSVCLSTCAAVVHGLAFDTTYFDRLRAFLIPPNDCPLPCWQGIRPGTTSGDDAAAILRTQDWITDVRVAGRSITWAWAGDAARALSRSRQRPRLTLDECGIVDEIHMLTRIGFADVWILLGPPDDGTFKHFYTLLGGTENLQYSHAAVYTAASLELRSTVRETAGVRDFWTAPLTLIWRVSTAGEAVYNLPDRFRR